MKVKVKICGIRNLESAQAAIDAGADFLGFNFVPTSKRYIYPIRAKVIIEKVRGKTKTVGVFQNQTIDEVNNIAEFLSLDYVQLHGEEDLEYVSQIKTNVIKTIVISSSLSRFGLSSRPNGLRAEGPTKEVRRVEGSPTTEFQDQYSVTYGHSGVRFLDFARNDNVEYLLLDRQVQGIGDLVNMEKAKEITKIFPTFLAGV